MAPSLRAWVQDHLEAAARATGPTSPAAVVDDLACPACRRPEPVRARWRDRPGVGHLGAYCGRCGVWIKWLPHRFADAVTVEPASAAAAGQIGLPVAAPARP